MPNPKPSFSQLLANPTALLAFGFGSGLSPIIPGTVGTLAAIPFYLLLAQAPWWLYLALIVVSFAVGIFLCGKAAQWLGVHDHGGIVWDEFVGLWITMFLAPKAWLWLLLGFIFFRFFDMVKPWPISLADKKLKGGFGIMADDALAGVAALFCLQACVYFWQA